MTTVQKNLEGAKLVGTEGYLFDGDAVFCTSPDKTFWKRSENLQEYGITSRSNVPWRWMDWTKLQRNIYRSLYCNGGCTSWNTAIFQNKITVFCVYKQRTEIRYISVLSDRRKSCSTARKLIIVFECRARACYSRNEIQMYKIPRKTSNFPWDYLLFDNLNSSLNNQYWRRLKRLFFGIFRLVVLVRRQPFCVLRTKISSKIHPFEVLWSFKIINFVSIKAKTQGIS